MLIEPIKELLKPYDIDTDECILWKGTLNGAGYPYLHTQGKSVLVTRLVLFIDGKLNNLRDIRLACHKCNNPKCINKKHLYAGTKKDNAIDFINTGEHNYNIIKDYCIHGHKLTPDNILRGTKASCKTCNIISKERHKEKLNGTTNTCS
jgi:hypothetical protein